MTTQNPAKIYKDYQYGRRFIDPGVLTSLRNLSLVARTVVEGFISGLHRSPYHGFSLDFAEYRAYTAGDDIRSVDWKVYARSDKFFVKKYEGETNTQLYILLDCSKSMAFSSHSVSKLDYGRMLAASLAYLARRQKDAVGLLTFDSKLIRYTPARTRRGHYQTLLHHLDESEDGRETDISSSVQELANFMKKKSLVVLISDLYEDPAKVSKALRFFHARGNDLVIMHLLDPAELDPPFGSVSTLQDMETGDRMVVVPESRKRYLERTREHLEQLKSQCAEVHIDYLLLSTEQPLDMGLRQYLTARARDY